METIQAPLVPGERFDRYELIFPIASGGMASVWVARMRGKHGFEKLVAVKTILPQFAQDQWFRSMFLDEASILSRIQHVNVAQILDVGEERGIIFLVMEYVEGDPMARLLDAARAAGSDVPIGIILRVLIDACAGLHAAHELRDRKKGDLIGLVHRDVSPQNILITHEGATKIIDFGIAKAKGRISAETNAGGVKGKLLYMPPEQATGRPVDRRADIWAIGAILYGAYAGRTPYETDTELGTYHKLVQGGEPPPLPESVPSILRDTIMRAVSASPEARFPTALELSRALENAMVSLGVVESQSGVAAFVAKHLAARAAHRERALAAALAAAAERERAVASGGVAVPSEALALPALHDSIPPTAQDAAPPVHQGTLAYEGLQHAHTAPGPVPTESTEVDPPRPPPLPKKGEAPPRADIANGNGNGKAAAVPQVPDLVVPALPKPAPPPPRRELPRFADDDEDEPVVVRNPMIASAAGSIVGPDVRPGASAPPPSSGDAAEPAHEGEFLDPMAIAAQRAGAPAPAKGAKTAKASIAPRPPISIPLETEMKLHGSRPKAAIVADAQAEIRRMATTVKTRDHRFVPWIAGAVVGGLLVAAGLLSAPRVAHSRALEAARQSGIHLEVERSSVGWGTIHFFGVTATMGEGTPLSLSAKEATLALDGFSVSAVILHDPAVTLDGTVSEVQRAVTRASTAAAEAAPSAKRMSLQNAHVSWTGPLAKGSRVDAEGVDVDFVRGARGFADEVHLTSSTTRITTGRGVLGPWRLDAERADRHERIRVGFDPVLADGPSAIFVRGDGGVTATAKIARQPLARLGIPHSFLGLAVDEQTQLEGEMQVSRPVPRRVTGDLRLVIHDARMTADAPRMDLVAHGAFAGDDARPLDLGTFSLAFGPLSARGGGAVTLVEDSFRIDVNWSVPPLPCGVLFNKTTSGQVSASGQFAFDSRRPDEAELRVTQASTCGLSLFSAR